MLHNLASSFPLREHSFEVVCERHGDHWWGYGVAQSTADLLQEVAETLCVMGTRFEVYAMRISLYIHDIELLPLVVFQLDL